MIWIVVGLMGLLDTALGWWYWRGRQWEKRGAGEQYISLLEAELGKVGLKEWRGKR